MYDDCVCVGGVQVKSSAPQLFTGSEDEEEGNEEDGSRFDIRPQFEGRAGQKVRRSRLTPKTTV